MSDSERNLIIVGAACGGAALLCLVGGIAAACLYRNKADRLKKQLIKTKNEKKKAENDLKEMQEKTKHDEKMDQPQQSAVMSGVDNEGFTRTEAAEQEVGRQERVPANLSPPANEAPATLQLSDDVINNTEVRALGGEFAPLNYYGGPSHHAQPPHHAQPLDQQQQPLQSRSNFVRNFPIPRVAVPPPRPFTSEREHSPPRRLYPEPPEDTFVPKRFNKPQPQLPVRNWQSQKEYHSPGEYGESRSQSVKYPTHGEYRESFRSQSVKYPTPEDYGEKYPQKHPMVPMPHKERRDFRGPYGPEDLY